MPDHDPDSTSARPIPVRGPGVQPSHPGDGDPITVDVRRRVRLGGRQRPAGLGSTGESGARDTGGGRNSGDASLYGSPRPSHSRAARPPHPRATPPRRRGRKVRRILAVAVLVVVAWAATLVWAGWSGWSKVHRVDATPVASDRPLAGSGTNYVMVGSDSRAGLTAAQRHLLATGNPAGQRTDTIMLVHLPGNGGEPSLVSIPRDSYVPIRGHGKNKINAAYSLGGAPLLVDTVEQTTGLRVDGFIEIGFGGFAAVVDSVDGVRMCLKTPMNDKKAGINLKAGCQVLDGKNALGYVRARYSDPLGDFGRVQRQRQFLGALLSKAASPANVLLPWRLHSIATAGGNALSVGQDDSMTEVAKVLLAVRSISKGNGMSLTVPVSDPNLPTPAGDAVKWDSTKALALFHALRTDAPLTIKP